MTSARQRLRDMQERLGITAKKSLGQNFLISDHVIEKILRQASLFQPACILEIGPGLGALTQGLRQLSDRLVLLELDRQLAAYWREQGYEVHEVDALQWEWDLSSWPGRVILVSNLPYQISASLVIDRSMDVQPLAGMVLMFQKEVAQRICAKADTAEYGFLSVIAQTFWDIETVAEAGPRDFSPPPKIASRVLSFNPRQVPWPDRRAYLRFVRACFLHPRKLLVSNLSEGLGREKQHYEQVLATMSLPPQVRAQQVRLAHFAEMFHRLGQ